MIFARGRVYPDAKLPARLDLLEDILPTLEKPPLPSAVVLDALESLGAELDSGALDGLIDRYAPPGSREELEQVRPLLTRRTLTARLEQELGPGWSAPAPRPFGTARLLPLGVLLHIAPGNMAGLPAYTAVEGLLTGNINLVKLPHGDRGLTLAILRRLTDLRPELCPYLYAFDFPSGDTLALELLSRLADGIVTWGGDDAVKTMRQLAPPGCKLIEWGHRLSFAYLSGDPAPGELADLADHVISTGGLLCSACQVIYLDTDRMEEADAFCRRFLPALERSAGALRTTPGQKAQASLYARETWLEHIVDGNSGGDEERFFRGRGCSVTLRPGKTLELSPLHGNVLVKCLPRAEIFSVLRRHKGRLQTAGLLCPPEEREELTGLLLRAGVNRVTAVGHMSRSFPGEAHDGEYPLRRYTRVADVEEPQSGMA